MTKKLNEYAVTGSCSSLILLTNHLINWLLRQLEAFTAQLTREYNVNSFEPYQNYAHVQVARAIEITETVGHLRGSSNKQNGVLGARGRHKPINWLW